MISIRNIVHENGIKKIFKFIVPSGSSFQGEYKIEMPDGWNDVDSIINIDDENFRVKDFIIGENTKLKFYQYDDDVAYNVLENVYEEQKGDGRIIFKWIAVKDGIEYDLLKDNFEVNMNKYSRTFDKSNFKIEIELIKSEAQNKLFNRDDVTIDLFALKDIDENEITPVETYKIGYKKGNRKQSNFYSWDISQDDFTLDSRTDHFVAFHRSDDYQFGNNTNEYCGFKNMNFGTIGTIRSDEGPFVTTDITLKSIKIEISNMHFVFKRSNNTAPAVRLCAIIRGPGQYYAQELVKAEMFPTESEIKINNDTFNLSNMTNNSNNLMPGQSLSFLFVTDDPNDKFTFHSIKTNTSIEITTNMESPIVSTKGVRIFDALNQVVKNYTSSKLSLISNYIGPGGIYFNTSISTGIYLRGLPPVYTVGQKIKTSLKSIMSDGLSKLLALGYDILDNKVIVEDIGYFFKDINSYDLSEKLYLKDDFKFENDKDVVFNSLLFGSKKYSKNVKDDIQNFITASEFTTPIVSVKNKLDKQTDLIIDEYKIQELIEDNSSSTNDNDDDLVMIDMINKSDYLDNGIFANCKHANKEGKLTLTCTTTPFDTTMMEVGTMIQILEGINTGKWVILKIDKAELTLSKTSQIQEGVFDTPIRYLIPSLIKNRSMNDGFTDSDEIRNPETSTNARHNPKYHMARWSAWFGSGLRKKKDTDLIKVTNYKNNSKAKMRANSMDLINELQGLIEVGANETLARLREYSQPFFSGDRIEISYSDVTFEEFISLYENWRYGHDNDRMKSRGSIIVNTPMGISEIFPFGDGAFSHSRKDNVLSIKGKVKGKFAAKPVLLSVNQLDRNTVELTWDYDQTYVNPKIDIQYTLDGFVWTTIKQVQNLKQDIVSSDVFNELMTGTSVHFRILVSTDDLLNKASNTLSINWKFNDYVIQLISKTESADCGNSRLILDITGTVSLNLSVDYEFVPSGGKVSLANTSNNTDDLNYTSPYGQDSDDGNIGKVININNETKRLIIDLVNSDKNVNSEPLNCRFGDTTVGVFANSTIKFKNTTTNQTDEFYLSAINIKKYIAFSTPPEI
ncbi:hypothetical protein [Chryseobacterium sp. JK1]|uniref:hypothetical protein n=1 Tax=Chryseobacterium sp. JK1 TaxID=874294 RepID=UPI003D68A147